MKAPLVIIGAGGHGAVVADAVLSSGGEVAGFLDDMRPKGDQILGRPVLGPIDSARRNSGFHFVLAIGDNEARRRLAETWPDLHYCKVIHPSAVVADSAGIAPGAVILAGAVVGVRARIGRHVIVNTGAIIEHDNNVDDYAHIAPRAVLGGAVGVGAGSHIGLGAAVRDHIAIGAGVRVGAGAVVVANLAQPGLYLGIPARQVQWSGGI